MSLFKRRSTDHESPPIPGDSIEFAFGWRQVAHAIGAAVILTRRLDGESCPEATRMDIINQAVDDMAEIMEKIG